MKKFLCVALVLVCTSSVQAQLIDPATLHLGPGTTLDPVQLPDTGTVTVLQEDGGAKSIGAGWLLILGIPNVSSTSAEILSVNGTATAIFSDKNGQPDATMTTGQEAYTQLGLSGPGVDHSNNFTNWSGADKSIDGITATSFDLFVFDIPAVLNAKGTDTEVFANLPVGTFLIAYGANSQNVYVTPFTEAGLITPFSTPPSPTPEPASASLLGLGLVGLGAFAWRRKRQVA